MTSIVVPDKVYILREGCFEDCIHLAEVIFGPGSELGILSARAFQRSGVRELNFTKRLKEVGDRCLAECRSLVKLTFEIGTILAAIGREILDGSNMPGVRLPY